MRFAVAQNFKLDLNKLCCNVEPIENRLDLPLMEDNYEAKYDSDGESV